MSDMRFTGMSLFAAHVSSDFKARHVRRAIDHHWEGDKFATAGVAVDIWDHSRSEPISTYSWGADSVLSVRFNPVRSGRPIPIIRLEPTAA
jgi:hypothetical protein